MVGVWYCRQECQLRETHVLMMWVWRYQGNGRRSCSLPELKYLPFLNIDSECSAMYTIQRWLLAIDAICNLQLL